MGCITTRDSDGYQKLNQELPTEMSQNDEKLIKKWSKTWDNECETNHQKTGLQPLELLKTLKDCPDLLVEMVKRTRWTKQTARFLIDGYMREQNNDFVIDIIGVIWYYYCKIEQFESYRVPETWQVDEQQGQEIISELFNAKTDGLSDIELEMLVDMLIVSHKFGILFEKKEDYGVYNGSFDVDGYYVNKQEARHAIMEVLNRNGSRPEGYDNTKYTWIVHWNVRYKMNQIILRSKRY